MKKIKILIITTCSILFGACFVSAQNLVPNPSFEDTTSCPTNSGQLNKTILWINPTQGSPDYFNECSNQNNDIVHVPNNFYGSQMAKSGKAYAGIYVFNKFFKNSREYIEILLTTPFITNEKYAVSFYVSLADSMQYSINTIGAYFSNTQVSSSNGNCISYVPQIQNKSSNPLTFKANWQAITDTLIANGGEQYMTIGNFMVDSLSDTLLLNNGAFFTNYSYYYVDSISVIDIGSVGIKKYRDNNLELLVYPNPTNGKVYVSGFNINEKTTHVEITDIAGKLVYKQQNNIGNGIIEFNLLFVSGVYFIRVTDASGATQMQKIIINN